MPARKKARRYYADDMTHTVSERSVDFDDGKVRLFCNECCRWYEHLVDTRAKDHYVCGNCYRKYAIMGDWKHWGVGY